MPLHRVVVRRNPYLSCRRKCLRLLRSSWTSQTVRLRLGTSSFLFPDPHAHETDWISTQETGGSFADYCKTAEKLMVALRDGRKLIGVLRSWDQFGAF